MGSALDHLRHLARRDHACQAAADDSVFDYYELAHPEEGVGSGFKYKTVPHVTLKSIANNEPAEQETLYDQPFVDNSRARVTGPFTVEAVPAPVVKPLVEIKERSTGGRIDRASGETLRQANGAMNC